MVDPCFYTDVLQLRTAADKLEYRCVFLDSSGSWACQVFNGRAGGQPLVLLLKDQHFRLVKPVNTGFPPEWMKSVGGSLPRGGGCQVIMVKCYFSWTLSSCWQFCR